MSELKLGKLIDTEQQRDAVHVAVAPVVADERLSPGQHVGFVDKDAQIVGPATYLIGIIDPFLNEAVGKGESCWLFLYPNTVTGMRHHWSHPAFGPHKESEVNDESFSRKWLEIYAAKMNCYETPEQAYQTLIQGLQTGELFAHGTDLHGFYELADAEALKEHAEKVLGIKINWGAFEFTCSC